MMTMMVMMLANKQYGKQGAIETMPAQATGYGVHCGLTVKWRARNE